jgi:hypothetical protein
MITLKEVKSECIKNPNDVNLTFVCDDNGVSSIFGFIFNITDPLEVSLLTIKKRIDAIIEIQKRISRDNMKSKQR